ncbi:pilus assembly protein PilM [Candidatus Saccharibacteria bacterium]|jgi:type IV pilus assembly protein PilM|nr:pilus assembly protein PilM [Candidatus Saccharibacteria bacterium]
MQKLFHREKTLIGLDINNTDIKVMAIDQQKWTVLGYGAIDVDSTKMKKSLEEDPEYLSLSVNKLLTEKIIGELPSDHAIVSLPTSRTYSRTFTIPASSEKSLQEAVELEVNQYVPIPLSLLYIDYEIIERTKESLTITMSAVPQITIDNILQACDESGLVVNAIEPGINSVARLLKETEDGSLVTIIVDIGPSNTDIAVLDGSIRVTGGITTGGNTFTLDIAKHLGITLENAHQFKVLNGLNPGPRQKKITTALEPSLKRITSETRRVMRYYNERVSNGEKIEQLLIVGGGSNVPGIGEYFTNDLVMAARVASPWQKLDFGSLAQPTKQFRPRYITVAGLSSISLEEIWQ